MRPSTIIIGTGTLLLLTGCAARDQLNQEDRETPPSPPAQAETAFLFTEKEYDFGVLKQSSGKVSHDFVFTYNGNVPVTITGVPTSCACTAASVQRERILPGETGTLTVTFNPNLHREPEGKFYKSVTILTDPPLAEQPEVKIWAEIDLDLGTEAFELQGEHEEEKEGEEGTYQSVLPEQFARMLADKDFFLVDVHVPEQEHIGGTDLFLPYTDVEENLGKFPQDKNAKIVLYCRSGGMSRAAVQILSEHGYTNVYDLVGGKNAYDAFLESKQTSRDYD